MKRFERPIRVLVVDDVRDGADSLALLLANLGAETRCAYSGKEAVREARRFKPEVALVDIGLPDTSGYEVARGIRAQLDGATVLLVALTGFGDEDTAAKAKEAGFHERLVKPVDVGRVRELIQERVAGVDTETP